MRKTVLVLLAVALGMGAGTPAFAVTNLGSSAPAVFHGNVITNGTRGPRLLYAPSESDDPAYRAAMAAQVDGTCDYFDARFGTPDASMLANYDCVMTWVNYAYADNVTFGNNLADFVDRGQSVVLGAFCAYTSGNYLSGRIMTDTSRYCPVTGGSNHFTLSFWDGSAPDECVHTGITSYGSTYRDYLTLVGPGVIMGRFQDGEIANAMNVTHHVVYANGAGGYPLSPVGQDAERAGNASVCYAFIGPTLGACCLPSGDCEAMSESACASAGGIWQGAQVSCEPGLCSATAAEPSTWGALKTRLLH